MRYFNKSEHTTKIKTCTGCDSIIQIGSPSYRHPNGNTGVNICQSCYDILDAVDWIVKEAVSPGEKKILRKAKKIEANIKKALEN